MKKIEKPLVLIRERYDANRVYIKFENGAYLEIALASDVDIRWIMDNLVNETAKAVEIHYDEERFILEESDLYHRALGMIGSNFQPYVDVNLYQDGTLTYEDERVRVQDALDLSLRMNTFLRFGYISW